MKLGLIGSGRMGRALAIGAIDAGTVAAPDVLAYDVHSAATQALQDEREVRVASSLTELAEACEVLLLCTKPGNVPEVLEAIAQATGDHRPLLLSIAAGVTIQTLESHLPEGARVIRSMPNTPALVGRGAAAFTRGTSATTEDAALASELLGAVGTVVEVKESLMDAVTGLSGSGPAYVYLLIEALADGGVKNGLPREAAAQLAAQTVLGAAEMVQRTGTHPAVLREMVTSPGGTTIAGLAALESGGLRAACIEAVTAATKRAQELGQ